MTTVHDMKQLNPYYIQETLERLLSQLGLFYKPCQSNKKKVKDFFLSFPFFFYHDTLQNELYDIIHNKPITSYYDSNETMMNYCFYIYESFSLKYKLNFKTKEEFYEDSKRQMSQESYRYKQWKQSNIRHYLFIALFCLLIILYVLFEIYNPTHMFR